MYIVIVLVVIVAVLNLVATVSAIRSPSLEKSKLPYQIAFIWLIPVMGAMFVRSLLREPSPSRRSEGYGDIDGYGDGTYYGHGSHDTFGSDAGGDGGGH